MDINYRQLAWAVVQVSAAYQYRHCQGLVQMNLGGVQLKDFIAPYLA